jgi:hypothetical protein
MVSAVEESAHQYDIKLDGFGPKRPHMFQFECVVCLIDC